MWPLSRASYPKQFLSLSSENPMLVETVRRIAPLGFAAPTVVCNNAHRFLVAQSLSAAGVKTHGILLEPEGRNTAIATAIAALWLQAQDDTALMLVMPSDHLIGEPAAFYAAIEKAVTASKCGFIATFGITPSRPETGYGYIKRGAGIDDQAGVYRIEKFVEKPTVRAAESYLASGAFHWNAGIFMARVDTVVAEMGRHAPDVLRAATAALAGSSTDLDFIRLSAEAFATSPMVSFDHAVMEKTAQGCIVVAENMDWSDIGSWRALWEVGDKDDDGNVATGDIWLHDTRNSLIRSADGILTAVIGLDNIVVIATNDALLVADMSRSEEVKKIVEELTGAGRVEHLESPIVHRPWGSYRTLEGGSGYLVKRITVSPKASLSLQYHHHRAEHWVVVAGIARVKRGNETFTLQRNESTFIPIGEIHRLENPGDTPLHLIEVQSGNLITEDDIIRLEDKYGRQLPTGD